VNRYYPHRRSWGWTPGRRLGILLLGWQLAALTAVAVPSPPEHIALPNMRHAEHVRRPSSALLIDADIAPLRAMARGYTPSATVPPRPWRWGFPDGAAFLLLLGAGIPTLLALGTASGPPAQPLVTRHSPREARRKLRVLLAEDNPVNQGLVMRLLEKRGHTVEVVANGKKVLETLDRDSAPRFDLILMDMQMPEMDGAECVARIRAKENGTASRIPIIALTAHALSGDRERFLALGTDGYLPKPVRAQELFETIEGLLQLPSGAMRGENPETNGDHVVDRQQVLSRFEQDKALLGRLIRVFVDDCPKLLAAARDAAARQDAAEFQRAARVLKNSLAFFSARAAFEAAQKAELIGCTQGVEHTGDALAWLEEELESLQPALSDLGREVTP
jgi:CheY-like chemotaxis protein